jgi:uncharacterized membrane protein
MKQNFFTGFVILLPMAMTFLVINFLINFLTNPFLDFTQNILHNYPFLDRSLFIFSSEQVLLFWSRLFILIFVAVITILTGFITRLFFLNYLFILGESFIQKIPFVNRVYKAIQDAVKAIFNHPKKSFTKIVLVPFPHQKAYAIGIVPNSTIDSTSDHMFLNKLSIFLPGTPNPTMGFMLLYNFDQVIMLDMTLEEALKYIVSFGMIKLELKVSK